MKTRWMASGLAVVLLAGGSLLFGCKDESAGVGTRAAPPPAPSAPAPHGADRFRVSETGTATFLIDAPLEKIKGRSTKFRGYLDVDAADLMKTKGQIDLDLDDLKTETFDDKDKNATQTEHAHNWLEIGADAKARADNRWARFTFASLESASPAKLADAPEQNGARTVHVIAKGDMWLHGVTSQKTVKLTVIVTGPSSAPASIKIASDEPIRVSLKEHDVKPRDVAGKFLNGALEKVGKKIDDAVQVTLDVTAARDASVSTARAP